MTGRRIPWRPRTPTFPQISAVTSQTFVFSDFINNANGNTGNFRAAGAETNLASLGRLAPRCFGTVRGSSLRAEEYVAPTVACVRCNECRLIPHTRGIQGLLRCSSSRQRRFEPGNAKHPWLREVRNDGKRQGGIIHSLDIFGCISSSLEPRRAATCHLWERTVAIRRSGSFQTS